MLTAKLLDRFQGEAHQSRKYGYTISSDEVDWYFAGVSDILKALGYSQDEIDAFEKIVDEVWHGGAQ